jgi:fructose-1,6-bisphosphatase/inositol monophosphatase family enzyme
MGTEHLEITRRDTLRRMETPRLRDLCRRIRSAVRGRMRAALDEGDAVRLALPVARGAGDVTFGIDVAAEQAVGEWLLDEARRGPLSVLTEDAGWRHVGPGPTPGDTPVELAGFDHGGPRISIDPIDGTRNLMHDLRGAWTIVSYAGPGRGAPRLADVELGVVSELPDTRGAHYRELIAVRGGGCTAAVRALGDDLVLRDGALLADTSDRADHGYFPFFGYHPAQRAAMQQLALDFFERVQEDEGAELGHCYDDQHISSGGQLALLALGHYRMVVDARQRWNELARVALQTAKPYDVAGAILVAREVGAVVTRTDGGTLDFPLDVTTPVEFVAFHNRGTGARLWPHLEAALTAWSGAAARHAAP